LFSEKKTTVPRGKLLALAVKVAQIKNGWQPFLKFNFVSSRCLDWGLCFVIGLILLP